MYYEDKIDSLAEVFGAGVVRVFEDRVEIDGRTWPVVDDVIVLLDPSRYPAALAGRTGSGTNGGAGAAPFAEDVQYSFGEEWKAFSEVMDEHAHEFAEYFDIVDVSGLAGKRVCDLGCGIGRWSHFLAGQCREMVLVDFSEAVFVARKNLAGVDNALFFMADLTDLPFASPFCDFLFCLGVLHHLPVPALDQVRRLKGRAPEMLVYLYYAMDNRPAYFRALFKGADVVRRAASRVRSPVFRDLFTTAAARGLYMPFILLGKAAALLGLGNRVPLYEYYNDKSMQRIRQDVYDRFFTSIEQRFTKKEILALRDTFAEVVVSECQPYWHFLCRS
ncbi:MAG: class I SAM-dependent methyltransferase [Desulfatibacillaceae bacterium]